MGEAISDFKKSIEVDPAYAAPYTNLGNIYLMQKNYADAQKCFEKAVKHNPDLAPAYNSLACLLLMKEDYKSSIENLNIAIQIQPEYPDSYYNRGVIHVKNRDYSSALTDFRKYDELKSKVTKEPYLRVRSQLETANLELSRLSGADKVDLVKELEELIAKIKEGFTGK